MNAAFFLSGRAHTYYALLAAILIGAWIALSGFILAGLAIVGIAAGVFADEWAHGYLH